MTGTEADAVIYADYLLEMTTSGEIVWEWRSWEHLEPERYPVTAQDFRHERDVHGNTGGAEIPAAATSWSASNISTVVIERATGNIIWQINGPPLAQQHDPRPLPNGNILIFDNGTHRRDNPVTFSRVIEVDPRSSEIVWRYTDQSIFEFFSPYISGAQRLANGNTLICEGCHGRIFEVTHEGEVVWEYVSPHFFQEPGRVGLNNWYSRLRYDEDFIRAISNKIDVEDCPSWDIHSVARLMGCRRPNFSSKSILTRYPFRIPSARPCKRAISRYFRVNRLSTVLHQAFGDHSKEQRLVNGSQLRRVRKRGLGSGNVI